MAVPNPRRVTPTIRRKGRRLHEEGKVRFIRDGRVYIVHGDRAAYIVSVVGDLMACNCPHHGICSHVQAVRVAREAGADPARVLTINAAELTTPA
jgi:predicted nucleic acid-binding Zn finger protein